ncbi:ubiquitin carboxyl-terminal hydrolase 32 isoform X3 [Frankliniella occidentalis]|uniref:Ubiquitin carboxyl-terminal hydrolase 32 n=1 Tax=Frankliniella occidentalis TaxID=133901 RepID=A0A6J1SJF9_FRAOC|nr:ubiquitin carboxyl-terminal hydrolase 32 isoform X3 [Frankliniella occidentalis]
MGVKDSKPCCITYEDAVRRVSESELKRIREAFKRVSNVSGFISKSSFLKEVLGEGVPRNIAEHIFSASGGTQKGIAFKELLCGLVLLTRGKEEEKIKFLFNLYSNDPGTYVLREDIERLLAACENGRKPLELSHLFQDRDRATWEEFRDWVLSNSNATSLSRWLLSEPCSVSLSNEHETPTFYQTLAGVTHLEEKDIIELEKRYWVLKGQSSTGRLDLETLGPLLSPPVPLSVCSGVFGAFDENRDQHIDFKEMACGISAACRGPTTERQKFCFKVFDSDRDGILSPEELKHMVDVLLFVRQESRSKDDTSFNDESSNPETIISDIKKYASNEGLTLEEYLIWTVDNNLSSHFLNLLFQVCHVVLGLRPQSRQEEGSIVNGWLEREEKRGYIVGQFWYLVAMDWWKAWNEYVSMPYPAITQTSVLEYSLGVDAATPAGSLELQTPSLTSSNGSGTSGISSIGAPIRTKLTESTNSLTHLTLDCPSITSSPTHSPRPNRRYVVGQRMPQKPGAIDNLGLVATPMQRVLSLTGEGGKLKKNLILRRWQDFELVPDSLWKALHQWYGGAPALPRQVIKPQNSSQVELELYPLTIRLLRHQNQPSRPGPQTTWTGMVGGYGAAALSTTGYAYVSNLTQPKRYLAHSATFSRMATVKEVYDFLSQRLRIRPEDMRLWHFKDESNMIVLEDEEASLEDLRIVDEDQLLIEVRNKDLTWPEEMGGLQDRRRSSSGRNHIIPAEKGATGLNNLGNTCFMNAALQCVSNTRSLTQYFTGNMHLYELNRTNPLGMKGHIAKRYGDLIQDIWSGSAKTIAPLKLRWTIGKYAPRFNGDQQHDSQELLAFLLDGLHEDLNRVHDKPYTELKDSDGRSDVTVAQEAWENHILRNKSIIVDLFHGQLKSKVICKVCSHESVRFDPFNYLSLPLPMESYVYIQVIVIRLDGSVPVKYGLRLNMDGKYAQLKLQLAQLCDVSSHLLCLAEVNQAQIKNVPSDDQKIKTPVAGSLYAYELPASENSSSFDDERSSLCSTRSQREGQTLVAIQRTVTPRSVPSGGASVLNGHANEETASVWSGSGSRPAPRPAGESPSSPPRDKESKDSPDAESEDSGLPTSTASLPLAPCSSQGSASSGSLCDMDVGLPSHTGYIVAVHRKMIRQDVYFMSSQKTKPSLFGLPIVVPCSENTTHQDLYQSVWVQVARLVSPLPPTDPAVSNHAQDCDDSLGYEFPFILKAVNSTGVQCAWCQWYIFCRGCRIQCNDTEFKMSSSYLAVDWDPTALHLRYQTSQERVFKEHPSVAQTRQQQSSPIELDSCLEAFTKEEHLADDEKYYCSKCRDHQLASKKLQIWRLPPILIVHLKRFQFVGGKWVKSQKVVNFPYDHFNPTSYLAAVPKQTVIRHHQLKTENCQNEGSHHDLNIAEEGDCGRVSTPLNNLNDGSRKHSAYRKSSKADTIWEGENERGDMANGDLGASKDVLRPTETIKVGRERLVSTSLTQSPVVDSALQDFHQHRLLPGVDPFDLKYRLYAVVCHSGILGGGHYVSYACNPNGKWYCYNDSSCREVTTNQMDTSSAYMLFYEREGLCQDQYMPNVVGKVPDRADLDDDLDSDLKRCCLM